MPVDNPRRNPRASRPRIELHTDRPTSEYQSCLRQFIGNIRDMLSHPLIQIGLVVLLPLAVLSVASAWFSPYDPYQQNLSERLVPPSTDHLFGTDHLGRDIFRRTLAGGEVTMAIVVAAALSVLPIGLLIGILAGYRGGCSRLTFDGIDLPALSERARNALLGRRMTMILQDPRYSLNPVISVGEQVAESLVNVRGLSRHEARERTLATLASAACLPPS